MSGCTHNCETCGESCAERKEPQSFLAPANALSKIKKVIGVVSGKGGVGKSLVTALLSVTMRRRGYSVGILDADITGPSVPKMFGVKGPAEYTEYGILIMQLSPSGSVHLHKNKLSPMGSGSIMETISI